MTKRRPFRYFRTSPEIIRLAVMLSVGFPLSLRSCKPLKSGDLLGRPVAPLANWETLPTIFAALDPKQRLPVGAGQVACLCSVDRFAVMLGRQVMTINSRLARPGPSQLTPCELSDPNRGQVTRSPSSLH